MSRIRIATLDEIRHYGVRGLPKGLRAPIAGGSGPALDHFLGFGVATGTAASAASMTPTSAVAAGDTVVAVGMTTAVTGSASHVLSDNAGNSYTLAESTPVGNVGLDIASASVTDPLATTNHISYSIASATGGVLVMAASFSGVEGVPYAGNYVQPGTTQTTVSVTSESVPAGTLVVAAALCNHNSEAMESAPSGFTTLRDAISSAGFLAAYDFCYKVTTTAGTVTASWQAFTTGNWAATIMALAPVYHGQSMMM